MNDLKLILWGLYVVTMAYVKQGVIYMDKINTIEIVNKHLYLHNCPFIEIDNYDGFM